MVTGNTGLDEVFKTLSLKVKKELGNNLQKIILFGSYARGDYDKESDVDIIVLVSEENVKQYEDTILDIAVELSIEYKKVVSIFLENVNTYMRYKNVKPFFTNIEKEGLEVYATT